MKETTEFFKTTEENGVTSVIYLKPILVQAPCLSCHGPFEQIGPDVKQILQTKYPDDKATGYQLDDLRGAVSIKKTL